MRQILCHFYIINNLCKVLQQQNYYKYFGFVQILAKKWKFHKKDTVIK